ncbi:MAG: choline/carnitine O-acyltransferase [Ornithinimicrobium sp.]
MDHLPVPPLAQTLERYLKAVTPLLEPEERVRTEDAVARTLQGDGPACQGALEAFARGEDAQGRSWLSEGWLQGYLAVRTPLPLSSNVGFQIHVPGDSGGGSGSAPQVGPGRAAAVVHRLATVHLAGLRAELPSEHTARGEAVCGVQRRVLSGGVRHPRPEVDETRSATHEPGSRRIGVLVDDRFFTVQVSDEAGHLVPASLLERALEAVLDLSSQSEQEAGPGFTAVSYLGSQRAAPYLERMMGDPHNRRVYDHLAQALFVVHLVRGPAEEIEHLTRTAFLPGHAWAYTPITYQIGLADDFVGMHLEHSRVDAATLKATIELAQRVPGAVEHGWAGGKTARVESMAWRLPADLAEAVSTDLAAYAVEAQELEVHRVRVPTPVPQDLSIRISDDALCQWTMLYAQRATYGRVRSTYEAVDLRHFQAGRTECLRSNTPEAVTLVEALIQGRGDQSQLDAALSAHKEWIKACKTGQGIDRHLTGLGWMATASGRTLPVLEDAGWGRITTDFLSTTSIGDQQQICGMAFAPTSAGGLGINYTPVGQEYEFLVTSRRSQRSDVERFTQHLHRGAQALAEPLLRMVECD